MFEVRDWWASPYINHFVSADSIVSSYSNPQDLNRYSYVTNNPVRYSDPTGHMRVTEGPESKGCSNPKYCNDGKPKPKEELKKLRNEKKDKDKVVKTLQNIATGLDILAWGIDLYNAGVVTYGGIFGAGVGTAGAMATPLAPGVPEIAPVTGLAGMGIAELYVQPTLQLANGIATISTLFTAAADIRSGETNLSAGVVGRNTLNSVTTTTYGYEVPEAYSSLILQSVAVSNDLGWISFPFPK
jgi:hypothetical protein